jgi:hypothetical protein
MQSAKNVGQNSSLPPRLRELQKKIQDENYINSAVDRIALIVSRRIVELNIDKKK